MKNNCSVTSGAPYIYAKADSSAIMTDVILALLPCFAVGIYLYGWDVALNGLICAACSVGFETVYQKALNKPITAFDLSAVVTGLIVCLNMPVSAPVWIAIIACFIAIVLVKQLFGGIGRNFANPALVGILTVKLGFSSYMDQWTVNDKMTEVIVSAAGGKGYGPTALELFRRNSDLPSDLQMLVGLKNGPVSQACAIAVLIGFVYLVLKRIILPWTSLGFAAAIAAVSLLSGYGPVFQLCAGGTLFFGIFMANDYTTSPITKWGKLLYGVLFGLITMFFRSYSSYEDSIGFALLFANLLVPYLDALTRPRPFGSVRGGRNHD